MKERSYTILQNLLWWMLKASFSESIISDYIGSQTHTYIVLEFTSQLEVSPMSCRRTVKA